MSEDGSLSTMRPFRSSSSFRPYLVALLASASPLVFVQCVSEDSGTPSENTSDAGDGDASPDVAVGDASLPDAFVAPDATADAGPPPTGTFVSDLVLPDITIATSIATAANGDTVIGGELTDSNAVVINGASYTSAGSRDIFVTKIAPNDGYKWTKDFGGTGDDRVAGVAVDASGNVYVVGSITFATATTTITFGTSPAVALVAQHAGQSSFLLKLDATDGHALWATSFDAPTTGAASCDAVTARGTNVAVACGSTGDLQVNFAEGSIVVPHQSVRGDVVALIDPATGNVVSSGEGSVLAAIYLVASSIDVAAMAFDASGGVALAGSIGSSMNAYVSAASPAIAYSVARIGTNPSAADAFVLKLGSDLSHSWDKVFGAGTQRTVAAGVAVNTSSNVYVAGNFQGSVDFGGGPATAIGASDAFVVALDGTGKPVAHATFGGSGSSTVPAGLAVDANGDVVTAGTYQGIGTAIKIGSSTMPTTNGGAWAAFTAKFDGTLASPLWAFGTAYPGATTTSTGVLENGVSIDPTTRDVLTTGSLIGTADFGDGTMATRSNAIYFVRRSP